METRLQPTLTIGMIFRNDALHLERCLKALAPLREALPCELIMADTGSDDGSRQIAFRYADLLFDFPWIDDFSAARNAVIKKASGEWYLSIDSDEYLDSDISELIAFLKSDNRNQTDICSLVIRNYISAEEPGKYSDFFAMRLMRMSAGLRFKGAIHEALPFEKTSEPYLHTLQQTLLHHDGYIGLTEKEGERKRNRNLTHLRRKLSQNPEDLLALLQYVESGKTEDDFMEKLRLAASLVEKKQDAWDELGPSVFRHAVYAAQNRQLPELNAWITRAQEWFPDSFFTRIDVEYVSFMHSWDDKDYASCIAKGRKYLEALKDYQKGQGNQRGLIYGCLTYNSAYFTQTLRLLLSAAYAIENEPEQAIRLLDELDFTLLSEEHLKNFMYILCNIHTKSNEDTSPALLRLFSDAGRPVPDKAHARKRMADLYNISLHIFTAPDTEGLSLSENMCRPPHTLFLPLGEQCELGIGAMIMETNQTGRIHMLLSKITDWNKFPSKAMFHALECGISFPLPECPLTPEETDRLISGLTSEPERLCALAKAIIANSAPDSWQNLLWKRGVMLAAVKAYPWTVPADETEQENIISGLELARLFAKTEHEFLPRYYAPELLCRENLSALPSLHRFGWHCSRAFDALDAGDSSGYVQELKAGMESAPETNVIVEYLLNHTPQLQEPQKAVSKELLSMAGQIKKILELYPENDPAVLAIKASPAYQKVAGIINGTKSSLS